MGLSGLITKYSLTTERPFARQLPGISWMCSLALDPEMEAEVDAGGRFAVARRS